MTDAAVRVQALRFAYGVAPVLEDVSFEVATGEIFGIVGADGSGKSTLLKLLIGQLDPSAGRIEVLGDADRSPGLRECIAYMPQAFGQYLDLSVQENLEFFASLHGLRGAGAERLIDDLVGRAGLRGFEGRRAGQLSGGMMQKLALACALVTQPRAMFLDEPTTGVDPVSRRAFWELLEGVCADGVAIVCTTANMDEAERCHRVASLEGGRLVRQGRPAELVAQADAMLCVAHGDDARASVALLAGLPVVDFAFPVGRQVKIWLKSGTSVDTLRASLAGRALQLDPATPTLHDLALRELALAARAMAHG
jgi:ABC-2 type transport system ATP-binding protein